MSFDPSAAIGVLHDHEVRFVLIGGVAGAVHGSPSVTQDLDICPEDSLENLGRLAAALAEVHAHLRGVDDDVPFLLDARTLAAGDHFTFSTDLGDFDCLITPAGTQGYAELMLDAVVVDRAGIDVPVASLDALIRMKRAAGRAKDRAELEILGALRDELTGNGG
jgi:predicted nucleotidyltransferase